MKSISYKLDSITVISERPKNWVKNLKKFKSLFLGKTRFSKDCEITNQNYIDFSYPRKKLFVASSKVPLRIINKALGYNIYCTLQSFTFDKVTTQLQYTFSLNFKMLKSMDKDSLEMWRDNREIAYRNSIEYFMKCLFNNSFTEKGFKITTNKIIITSGFGGYRKRIWDNTALLKPFSNNLKILAYNDYLQVENNMSDNDIGTTSWIRLRGNETIIDENGISQDITPYQNGGFWANSGIANMLPKYYSRSLKKTK